ncbi:hypothetical protein HAZT_HAZT003523 [Hyalella azteca]|uniref:Cysteine-rich DPF motif domain-containing protein 1 n=1 Tax=Hyalella azteca TaxID=294128 RepID=A0A6A0HA03_HYAAZ|nr:hypothetical protein HAZT_HAZT003523 [Hyalella azteca]
MSALTQVNPDATTTTTEGGATTNTTAKDAAESDAGTFSCSCCGLTERYAYFGRNPRFLKNIVFLEDCYVIEDPFSGARNDSFTVTGSHCVACSARVCQSPDCSVFYSKRFCLNCARKNIHEMPTEMRVKINK